MLQVQGMSTAACFAESHTKRYTNDQMITAIIQLPWPLKPFYKCCKTLHDIDNTLP